ncbi:cardiolipin synthase [Dongia sp.]|uniref:cardiolipin synthase n=1 Tax=Dongia sp. TaxID=1977262 RepID=UPI0035B09642
MTDWLHPAFTYLLTAIHTLLALAVTFHVLLKKREVGSAIAWMGVAWLSPGLGVLLYLLFGINRVHRKAFRIRQRRQLPHTHRLPDAPARSDHLAQLELAVDRLTNRSLPTGNKVELLRDGEEAYPAMLAAIDKAAISIALSSYIFEADAAGEPFISALIRAQARNVDIRVIVDGVGSGYIHSPVFQKLRAAGIQVGRFMHSFLPWHMAFLNMRSHKKILVVDGTIAFLGGINITAGHLPSHQPASPIRDVHFRVTGPVVTQIAEAFAADWYFVSGEELFGKKWFPPIEPAGDAEARVITSGPDRDRERLALTFQQAIGCARSSIKLVTPYFLPEDRLIASLVLAAMRGVAIDIVIPAHSDNILVDWATRAHVTPLLEAGCRIWRAPKPFEHSKMFTIDGEWSLIGSPNWDVRSLRLNFEISLEVYDDDFAALIEQQVEKRKGRALSLKKLNRRALPVQLRDSAARLLLPYL